MRKNYLIPVMMVVTVMLAKPSFGQDPTFSQFFSSPLNVNPALTGHINADWRMILNLRDQWFNPSSPYATGTVSFDAKVFQNKIPNVEEKNIVGIGGMLMYDYTMNGIVTGVYGSVNLSYNILIGEDFYGNKHRLGLGFGGTYASRYIDFSRLNFQAQFTGSGFNQNLPNNEAALSNMTPFFSASAGFLYTYNTSKSNLDIGGAVYHLNEPKQTFLNDPYQFVPPRWVGNASFETFLNDGLVLNTNAIYQAQANAHYFSIGGALGIFLDPDGQSIFNVGVWYWSANAIVPYVGFAYNDLQIGLSYDATISKLNEAAAKPTTFEISIILRGKNKPSGIIPCPWK
jgi:type IX secretion system PorP/SprF family membrane protein